MSLEIEGYQERLDKEEARYFRVIRRARRHAWDNDSLSELERTVFGLTGSFAVLDKYKAMARYVDERQGQPIITPTRLDGRKVIAANGGIIAGELALTSSFSGIKIGTGAGRCILSVPVASAVYVNRYDELTIVPGDEVGLDSVEVGRIDTHELGDHTDPSKDFNDYMAYPALIGRQAIYHSEDFHNGINVVLEAIESA